MPSRDFSIYAKKDEKVQIVVNFLESTEFKILEIVSWWPYAYEKASGTITASYEFISGENRGYSYYVYVMPTQEKPTKYTVKVSINGDVRVDYSNALGFTSNSNIHVFSLNINQLCEKVKIFDIESESFTYPL